MSLFHVTIWYRSKGAFANDLSEEWDTDAGWADAEESAWPSLFPKESPNFSRFNN